uniref:Uncharacterized protein n=2 Tax=Caenorhabditis japonica TaxID=281687 RepID=A0A8R1DN32_CAEJA
MKIYPQTMNVYLCSCPTTDEWNTWEKVSTEILSKSPLERDSDLSFQEDAFKKEELRSNGQKVSMTNGDLSVIESVDKEYTTIYRIEKTKHLQCKSCPDALPITICSHMITLLRNLPENERDSELNNLSTVVRNMSLTKLTKKFAPEYSGMKIGSRKGHVASRHNDVRKISSVTDLTLFGADPEQDETESQENLTTCLSDSSKDISSFLQTIAEAQSCSELSLTIDSLSQWNPNASTPKSPVKCDVKTVYTNKPKRRRTSRSNSPEF